jgi:hypothetical protein
MIRCVHCPVSEALECPSRFHARYCELVNSDHRDYHPGMASKLVAMSLPGESVPQWKAKRQAQASCPSLGPLLKCGCDQLWRCLAGKGRPYSGQPFDETYVSFSECVDCLKANSQL